jgi:hypothetical protein
MKAHNLGAKQPTLNRRFGALAAALFSSTLFACNAHPSQPNAPPRRPITETPRDEASANVTADRTAPVSPPPSATTITSEQTVPLLQALTPVANSAQGLSSILEEQAQAADAWPPILGFGEIHAPRELEGKVVPNVVRMREELLATLEALSRRHSPPAAGPHADLVLELWLPRNDCKKEATAKVQKEEHAVTKEQATSAKNDYVELANACSQRGITPWLLKPTCEDFDRIANAKDEALGVMLQLTRNLTITRVEQLNSKQRPLFLYGGAMHNDLSDAKAAYGGELAKRYGKRYVAIDLIVPALVRRTDAFRKQPWFDAVANAKGTYADKPRVLRIAPQAYALIWPGEVAP